MKNPQHVIEIRKGATYEIPIYQITENGIEDRPAFQLKLCKGNKDNLQDLNQSGMFTESLLTVCKMYLESVNTGDLANRDTSIAITHIEDAIMRIEKRANDRKNRGVQATYQK